MITTSRVALLTLLHLVVAYLPAQTGALCLSSQTTLSCSLVLHQVTLELRFGKATLFICSPLR